MSDPLPATASWVVVPPFHNDAAWRAAIVEAAQAAGRQMHDLDATPEGPTTYAPDVIVLTSDASRPLQAGAPAEAIAGLLTESGIRLDPHEDPEALPQYIRLLTEQIARLGQLPASRIFRRQDFAGGAVEILPGFMLTPPAASSKPPLTPRLRAVTDAVALLDPARPRATWAPDLFNYNSRVVAGGSRGDLDLTGRPRCLLAGPYIVLPAGRWRATYRLTFDDRGSRVRIRVDWGGVEQFLSEEFVPGQPGVFEITQEYDWLEDGPAEIRLILMEGVFDGRMTFSGAEIERIG